MNGFSRNGGGGISIPVYALFAMNGLLFATWVSRLPAVRERLDANEAELGLVLLCIAIGSLISMPTTGWLCDRFGARRVTVIAVTGCAAAFTLAVAAPSIPLLGAALALAGATYGVWDVSMNASAHEVELRRAHPLMPRFHGVFSVGGLTGAGLGALAAVVGLPMAVHVGGVAVIAVVVGSAATRRIVEPPRHRPAPRLERAARRARRIPGRLAALGILTACATLGEGAAADWGGLFLHDERGASDATAAIGFAVFSCAMAIGRFGGTWAIDWAGRVRTLRLSGVVVSGALVVLVSIDLISVSLVAMVAWGLGVAIVFPAAMSAAAEHAVRPAQGIAMVATIGYGGFLVGPPLIGFLADQVGLGVALWVVAGLGLILIALAPAAAPAPSKRRDEVATEVPTGVLQPLGESGTGRSC